MVLRSCGNLVTNSLRVAREVRARRELVADASRAAQPRARPRRPRACRTRENSPPASGLLAPAAAIGGPGNTGRRPAHERGDTAIPRLGAHDSRALATRPRDARRRHRDPARTRQAARRAAGRGRHDLPAPNRTVRSLAATTRREQSVRVVGTSDRRAAATIGFRGAIAQLGERLDRTQEVGGSSPPSSTS